MITIARESDKVDKSIKKLQKEMTCKWCGKEYSELLLQGQCPNCEAFIF